MLYSDVVDALEGRPGALSFYLGHELGHVHRGHLAWRPALLPASFLPLIGSGYHRACETTCDNYGAACCDDVEDGVRALSALAAGGRRWQDLNLPEYLEQARDTAGFWMSFHELISDYPWLVKRVARVAAQGDGREPEVPSRHPLAYLFAFFVPRTMAGAGAASVLMMVAIIGIIAAIAIPSLLRARVSANESSAHRGRPQHDLGRGCVRVAGRKLRHARVPRRSRAAGLHRGLRGGAADVSRPDARRGS